MVGGDRREGEELSCCKRHMDQETNSERMKVRSRLIRAIKCVQYNAFKGIGSVFFFDTVQLKSCHFKLLL